MCEDCARERAAREAGPGACPDTSVSHGRKPRAPTFDEECFWKKVEKAGPDECWLWKGARAQSGFGYGSFRKTNAHRWLYIHLHGPLPRNRVVMHSCDNKLCVNPAHLSAGSNADNCWDASRKGRLHNQIPRETINEIKRRRLAGESSTTIAADLGLSANHLRKVAVVNACPACIRSRTYAADLRERLIAAESALAAEREAHAETRKEINALKSERNAALELAEKRGAAYDMTWREVESLRERLDKEEEERESAFDRQLTEVAALLAPTTHHSNVIEAVRDVLAERDRYREALREIEETKYGPAPIIAARVFARLASLDEEVKP